MHTGGVVAWRLRNAFHVAWDYLRWPYPMSREETFGPYSHDHTCMAAHLPNVKLKDVCPLAGRKIAVALEEDCEYCPYGCTIRYTQDEETGRKRLHFHMNEAATTTYCATKSLENSDFYYRGYIGGAVFSVDDGQFVGKILGIPTRITYTGKDEAEAAANFHKAVDEYLIKRR